MENKQYIKLWISYGSYFEAFSDTEVGRLVRAMIAYKSSGTVPEFRGNERFIWPAIKREMDEDSEKQGEISLRRSAAGKEGALAKKAKASQNKQNKQMLSASGKTSKCHKDIGERKEETGEGLEEKASLRTPKRSVFAPPSVEEVAAYCAERNNGIDPQAFVDYYAARGWKYKGSVPMKDWKAAVRTWEQRRKAGDSAAQTATEESWTERAERLKKELNLP